jgi:endonuclease/exonuclease/phosphatase family metal-dependent hydrolase
VLSRAPILEARFVPYSLAGLPQRITHADFYGGKGFVRLSIDLNGESFVAFGTHLHARYLRYGNGDEYLGHRAAEVVEIAAAIRAESLPVVVGGDFNFPESSPEHEILLGLTGLADTAAALDSREATLTLSNRYRLARGSTSERRIDYVFCQSGLQRAARPERVWRVLDEPVSIDGEAGNYSDHAGLVAEVALQGPGAAIPEPDPAAIARAHELLDSGRRRAESRRTGQRLAAGSSLLAGVSALVASRSAVVSRRRVLHAALLVLGGTAWAASAGLVALSEAFVPDELSGYERVSALLDGLTAKQASRLRIPRDSHSLRWSDGLPGSHLRSGGRGARIAAARHLAL